MWTKILACFLFRVGMLEVPIGNYLGMLNLQYKIVDSILTLTHPHAKTVKLLIVRNKKSDDE